MSSPAWFIEHRKKLEKRGFAIGNPLITTDELEFRFKDEYFKFPAMEFMESVNVIPDGTMYRAKIRDIREFKEKSNKE